MNKSKFLKKSLAMLLALMLVLAMIPLSASAAPTDAPVVSQVWVDGNKADLSGSTYSAEIVKPGAADKVEVRVILENDKDSYGVPYYTGLDDTNAVKAAKDKGAYVFEMDAGVTEATFYTTNSQSAKSEPYTVTFTTVDAKDDTSIASVHIEKEPGSNIELDVYNDDIADFVIVAPYGWTVNDDQIVITPTDEDADVSPITGLTDYNIRGDFYVTAQNGRITNYTVMVVEPIPFASFAIEDERHEAQISRVTEEPDWQVDANDDPQVEVYLPYGYDKDSFTPIFETNYDVKVWAGDVDDVLLESGETYKWEDVGATQNGDDYTLELTIEYSDHTTEPWTLNFDGINPDVIAAIKGLTVDNYVAEIDGTTITLTIPASVRSSADEIDFSASNGTEVEILNVLNDKYDDKTSGSAGTGDKGTIEIVPGLLADQESYLLRVTAPGTEFDADPQEPMVLDYTLNIVNAQVQKPKLNSMILQSEKTGEKIVGTIDEDSVVFTGIPYRYHRLNTARGQKAMQDDEWVLIWSASSGCTITSSENGEPIALSGSGVEEFGGILPVGGGRYIEESGDYQIVITNANGQTQSYFVEFTSAPASQKSELGDLKLAQNGVYDFSNVSDRNTINLAVDNVKHTISGSVFFNEWESYVNGTHYPASNTHYRGGSLVGDLPTAEAEIYFDNGNNLVASLDLLSEKNDSIGETEVLPYAHSDDGNLLYQPYSIDYAKADPAQQYASAWTGKEPLVIYVVSEAGAEKIEHGGATSRAEELVKDGLATRYEFTLTQMAPRTETNLEKISIYDASTGDRVEGKIEGGEINFEIPYYFIDSYRNSEDNLYLDFEPVRGGVTLSTDRNTTTIDIYPLGWNSDGELIDEVSRVSWYTQDKKNYNFVVHDADDDDTVLWLDHINVDPEGPAQVQEYKVNFTILEPKEEGVLNSVTLAGSTATPDDENKVTVNVPFATEVTKLLPSFNISENAFVVEGKWSAAQLKGLENDKLPLVTEGETFNFLQSREFTVVSEDHNQINTYTITVVPAETFSDVAPDQWYYDVVNTAAGKGWINGVGDGKFNPNGTMTRGDFALIVARIMGYDPEDYAKTAFPDVASSDYYSAAIAFCKEQGIIDGDDLGNFNPKSPITREQMAKIICQAKQLKVTIPEKTFDDDAKIAEWAKGYVYACQEAGIMEGDNGSFRPTDNATHAEGAAVLVRAFA